MARDGLLKMQDVYKGNPGLGDAASLNKGLDDSAQKLDQLNATICKFEVGWRVDGFAGGR